jgi:thiamine-monophosphate kinase
MKLFASTKTGAVEALGEEQLIASIRRWLGRASPPAPHGIGDDCAVLPPCAKPQVITVDPVIYGRHFDDSVPAAAAGAKLLKRNLSDLAAMGAKPNAAVVALTLDRRVQTQWLAKFYRGLAKCALRYRVSIVGGDVAQADGVFVASLTLVGQATGRRLVTREGARRGDWIYVTGELGGSLLGHHHRFQPRLMEGAWLAGQREVRAMMDLSDGLAKDLHALTPNDARPAIWPEKVPVSRSARRLASKDGISAFEHAACDGEDYELVFALDRGADRADFERRWARRFRFPLHCVGYFAAKSESPAGTTDLQNFRGYEHLRQA